MLAKKLKLNAGKREFLCISKRGTKNLTVNAMGSSIKSSDKVRNLGVLFDSKFTLESHVNKIASVCYMYIRNIKRVRDCLPRQQCEMLVHSFISSRLDFCNGLLYGLPDYLIRKLQRVQNSAAKLVVRAGKFDHVTPILFSLHWLPVEQRILYKMLLLTFKCLHGYAPVYLRDLISPYEPSPSLRSADKMLLKEPRTKSKVGERSFRYAAAFEWNRLPLHIKQSQSIALIKSRIKTYLCEKVFL